MAARLWYKVGVWRSFTIAALFAVIPLCSAQSSGSDTFEAGARAQGMAGAAATVTDYAAVYHNPANRFLGRVFWDGDFGTYDHTSILLMRRRLDTTRWTIHRASTRERTLEPGIWGMLIGATFTPFEGRLALAATVLMPFDGSNISTHFADEREHSSNQLQFTRLGHRADREAMGFAAAYRSTMASWDLGSPSAERSTVNYITPQRHDTGKHRTQPDDFQ